MSLTNRIFLILVALFYMGLTAITLFQKTWRVDLNLVLFASERLQAGQSMYQVAADSQEHTKPPLGTFVFVPFQLLSRYWVERVWDLFLLSAFFILMQFWMKYAMPKLTIPKWKVLILSLAVTFNCWNSELRCGQFNILAFLAVLMAVFGQTYLQGPAAAWLLWLKPTNIVFLPWIWRYSVNRKALVIGGICYTTGLSALYIMGFGWQRFLSDHREWLAAAPQSAEKHVARFDNLGIPSLLSSFTTSSQVSSGLQIVALVAAILITYQVTSPWISLTWIALVAVFFSPMAWLQNYVLMTPFVLYLWNDFFSATGNRKWYLGFSLLSLFVGFQVYNPTLWNHPNFGFLILYRPPALALILAVFFRLLADVEERVVVKATA